MGVEGDICRLLGSGKVKDKTLALSELSQLIKDVQTKRQQARFSMILPNYIRFFREEIELNQDKLRDGTRASILLFSNCLTVLKDLIQIVGIVEPQCLDSGILLFVQTVLEEFRDLKTITSQFVRILNQLVGIRTFRENITPMQWEQLVSYCIDFFMAEPENTSHDRRAECFELSMVFCQLITCQWTDSVMEHAEKILIFIAEYIQRYTFENVAFEIFLTTAIQVLIFLDVDQLQVSFGFLKLLASRLIELIPSKNESLRIASVNLLRMYIAIGSQREDDEELLRVASRMQLKLYEHFTNHTIHPIPSYLFYQLIKSPDYEKEFPPGVGGSLPYLCLFADLCWLETHAIKSDSDSQSQSTRVSTQMEERSLKRMRMKRFRSYLDALIRDKTYCAFGIQVIMKMVHKHPSTLAHVVQELFPVILDLAINGDISTVNEARMCCMLICELYPAIEFEANELWDKILLSIGQTSVSYHGSFLLLAKLIKDQRVTSDRIVQSMSWICQLRPEQISKCTGEMVQALFTFPHLWSNQHIKNLVSFLFQCLRFGEKPLPNQVYGFVIHSIHILFQVVPPSKPVTLWFSEGLHPVVVEEALLFDWYFDRFANRLELVSGYNGQKLCNLVWKQEAVTPIQVNFDFPIDFGNHCTTICQEFLGFLNEKANSVDRTMDVLVAFLVLCYFIHRSKKKDLDLQFNDSFTEQLEFTKQAIFSSAQHFELDRLNVKFFDFILAESGHVCYPLSEKASLDLLELCVVQFTKPRPNKDKTKEFKAQKYHILQTAMLTEPVDCKVMFQTKQRLQIILYLIQYPNLDLVSIYPNLISKAMQWIMNLLQTSEFTIINLTLLASMFHKMGPILELTFVTGMAKRFSKMLQNIRYMRNFSCWISCLKFIKSLLENNTVLVNRNIELRLLITELVTIFVNGLDLVPVNVMMDIVDVLKLILANRISIDAIGNVSEEIMKILTQEDFVSKLYAATAVIPCITPSGDSWTLSLDSMIQWDDISDISAIGDIILIASVIRANPNMFSEYAFYIVKIASIHSSLDTAEMVFASLKDYFGQPMVTFLIEQALTYILEKWDLPVETFPTFLFGPEDPKEFADTFCDQLCLVSFKTRDLKWKLFLESHLPSESWIERSLPLVYAEYLIQVAVNPEKKQADKLYLQSIFAITETEYQQLLKKHYTTIFFLLLKNIKGLDRFDERLDPYLGVNLAVYEVPTLVDSNGTSQYLLKAIQSLHSGNNFTFIANSISAHRLHSLLLQIHTFMDQVGFEAKIATVLSNGYILLLALGKAHLTHPLIFGQVFLNLSKYLCHPLLSKYCIPILNHLVSILVLPFPESFGKQVVLYIRALHTHAMISYEKGHDNLVQICKVIDLLLEKLQAYDDKMLHVCLLMLDPVLKNSLKRMNVTKECVETILAWPDHLDRAIYRSKAVYTHLDGYLMGLQGTPQVSVDRYVSRMEKEIKTLNKNETRDWDYLMASVYGKLLCYVKNRAGTPYVEDVPCALTFVLSHLTEYLFHSDLLVQSACAKVLTDIGGTTLGYGTFKNFSVEYRCIIDLFQQRSPPGIKQKQCVYDETMWTVGTKSDSEFLIEFCTGLIQSFSFPDMVQCFIPMVSISSSFAQIVIPYLATYALLDLAEQKTSRHWFLKGLESTLFSCFDTNRLAIETCVHIIQDLYRQNMELKSALVNLNQVSKLCLKLGDFQSSMFFLELWYCQQHDSGNVSVGSEDWETLIECYNGLKQSDGFQGALHCLDTSKTEMVVLVKQNLERQHDWLSLWSIEDSALQSSHFNDSKSRGNLVRALGKSGHYTTLMNVLGSNQETHSEMYESLWRLEKWNVNSTNLFKAKDDFQSHIYHALQGFETSFSNSIILNITKKQMELGILYGPKPNELVSMMEIDEFASKQTDLVPLVTRDWNTRSKSLKTEYPFSELEPIFSIRKLLLQSMVKKDPTKQSNLLPYYIQHNFDMIDLALSNKDLLLARKTISDLKMMEDTLNQEQCHLLQFVAIKTEWDGGQQTIPMRYLESLIGTLSLSKSKYSKLYSESLLTYAIWSMKKKSSLPIEILEKYLVPSIEALELTNDIDRGKHYFTFANYCDEILSEIHQDEGFKRSSELLAKREASLKQALSMGHNTKDHFIRRLEKQIDIDRAGIQAIQDEMMSFAISSIENYLKLLIHSEYRLEHSLYRFFALWFSYANNQQINKTVHTYLSQIQTKVFLPLMYQISARLFSQDPEKTLFFNTLLELVESIVVDYPYHTLGFVLALKNVSKTTKSISTVKSVSSETISLFLSWIKKNKPLQMIAYHIDSMFSGYISSAYQAVPKSKDSAKLHALDSRCSLFKIKPEHKAPVITAEQPLPRPKDYSQVIHILSFEKMFTIPGGINAPKVLKCLGSDGIVYKQLVKGKDDLRQDAVLSSVFNTINTLLQKNRNSRQRNLHIRTYKIVPVAPQAGVVHWVDGTNPLGDILMEAHSKNKKDWSLHVCRQKMKAEHDKPGSTTESKLKVFKAIEAHLKPVLSLVFFELYRDPALWYLNRNRFMQSVATSSMAGYILGIGDRHSQNLLFDKSTAEIIHIDLGIAFDQGKLLSTPELVPFRLTRNIVDAMGMTQYQGIFKQSCEETLKVLREEHEILFTLLDVFRYDPLHSWTVSPLKLLKLQREEDEPQDEQLLKTNKSDNDEAGIALFGIKKKLSSSISVEGQVQELINQAMDPRNLCRMFPGWQPWI